ncbi:MAG: DUF503 domain-containing protein [Chloroflexi bacterium]|jgi:uncharacterized protein YlxP (DUF503 family)|nr:DUF503 domain-containing protein [Chloroflexota bacterium]
MASVTGILTIHLQIPGCTSLKEKRSWVKPVLARLHREFNLSTAEVDLQDRWQEAVLACAIVSSSRTHVQQTLQHTLGYITRTWPDLLILDDSIEIL